MSQDWHVREELQFSDMQIRDALNKLIYGNEIYKNHSYCFFLDGLDELKETPQEDYSSLVRLLQEWVQASSGRLKICVSSREYNVFGNAFSPEKRIRLQELTRVDMECYARERLGNMKPEEERERITREIVHRSDGIFLWVALVVKALRECIEDDVGLLAFEAELAALPAELEELFEYLLSSVRKSARTKAYEVFALIEEMDGSLWSPLPLRCCLFLEEYERDQEFAIKDQFQPPNTDKKAQYGTAEKRLNRYCRGLVEVSDIISVGKCVTYSHRSIPEFLQKERIKRERDDHLAGFDTKRALSQLLLADLRSTKAEDVDASNLTKLILKWILFNFEQGLDRAPYAFLSRLDSEIATKLQMPGFQLIPNKSVLLVYGDFSLRPGRLGSAANGNFYLTSPFYVSACLGDFGYVAWRIRSDKTIVDNIYKRDFLRRCLNFYIYSVYAPYNTQSVPETLHITILSWLSNGEDVKTLSEHGKYYTGQSTLTGWIRYTLHEVFFSASVSARQYRSLFPSVSGYIANERDKQLSITHVQNNHRKWGQECVFNVEFGEGDKERRALTVVVSNAEEPGRQYHTIFLKAVSISKLRRFWGAEDVDSDADSVCTEEECIEEDSVKEEISEQADGKEDEAADDAVAAGAVDAAQATLQNDNERLVAQDQQHEAANQGLDNIAEGAAPNSPHIPSTTATKESEPSSLAAVSHPERTQIWIPSHVFTFLIGILVALMLQQLSAWFQHGAST
jgi:hypothetical protein